MISRPWGTGPMNLKRLLIGSIIGTGISSVTTQLLIIREFLTQFHGNEITISLVIFCWLLLTGLGSLCAKGVRKSSMKIYAVLTLAIALWPLLQIIGIREFRESFFIHGTSPGFYAIFFYIIAGLAPYCLLTGFILPYAQKVLNDRSFPFRSGDLYLTDSVGDITGGVLFSFILVYWMTPFLIIAFTSSLLIAVALVLMLMHRMYGLLGMGSVLSFVFFFFSTNPLFEKMTLTPQYGNIVKYLESPYGRIVVSKESDQLTVWESGMPLYSESTVIADEEKVHYPLCQLDRVGDVLLVSGGFGETIAEVSKYNPVHVDYVELDPFLTKTALNAGFILQTPDLHIVNTDGRHYIKTTKRRYDAIIVDLPEPDTFQVNRFFTEEFFSLAKGILKEGGIISMSVEYAPNYLSDIRKRKLSTLYNTARLHFQNVTVLPGEQAYFLCRDGTIWRDIPSRLTLKSIRTAYVEGFFYGNVTAERMGQLEDCLSRSDDINTDFRPKLVNIAFQEWFMKYGVSPKYFLLILFVSTVTYLIFTRREEYMLFTTGLATMGVEMLIVFAFQVIYGYIYLKIGAIVTVSLLGLLPGALTGNSLRAGVGKKLLVSEMLLLFLLFLFFLWAGYYQYEPQPIWFLGYCFVFSFLCGFQFPVAAQLMGEERSPAANCLAADLCGASVGTLVTGTVLIPLWGIQSAVLFLIAVKISSCLVFLLPRKARVSIWQK
jgi:spermidine synthase